MTRSTRVELAAFGDIGPRDRAVLGRWLTRCGWTLDTTAMKWRSNLLALDAPLLEAVQLQTAAELTCCATLREVPRC